MNKKKVAFFISARSEYGLLKWFIEESIKSDLIEPIIYIGGGILSPIFGSAIVEARNDFTDIIEIIEIPYFLDNLNASNISKSIGIGIISLSQIISEKKPELFVILGDRYDTFIPSSIACINNIPILHICGGDITEGVIDDQIRHSLTKLSHIHLVQTEEAARVVSGLGEEGWRIIIAGAPGIENIYRLKFPEKDDLLTKFKVDMNQPTILCTYHPETLEQSISTEKQLVQLINALTAFKDFQIILTYPGAENGSDSIIKILKEFSKENDNVFLFDNLGSLFYLGIMKYCKVVVGNSSSGIIEAPTLKIPTLDIGDRQKGRVASKSVIHCGYSKEEIINSIHQALSLKHQAICQTALNPYEPNQNLSFSQIALKTIIKMTENKSIILRKKQSFEVKKNEWNTFIKN